jgi:hypothetical protein
LSLELFYLIFILHALTDVIEDHYSSDALVVFQYWSAGVVNGEGGAVFSPEHLVGNLIDFAFFEGGINRAIQKRVWT